MQLVDSHCHLNFPELKSRLPEILENARENGIGNFLCIATTWDNCAEVLSISREYPHIHASVGVHPNTTEGHEPTVDELVAAGQDSRIVAVGETGLDYHWNKGDLDWQHKRFHRHIDAAKRLDKPLVIHTRAAADDTMSTLIERDAGDAGGVMHCFAEDWRIAKLALDIGFYISFSGIVTFKSAPAVQEVARKAPLDRILVETDSPYLAPVPMRGKMNQPAYVLHTAEHVAKLRDISLEALTVATTENYFRLFSGAAD